MNTYRCYKGVFDSVDSETIAANKLLKPLEVSEQDHQLLDSLSKNFREAIGNLGKTKNVGTFVVSLNGVEDV